MALFHALLVAGSLAAAAAAAGSMAEGGAQGRYFPGLPTPLAPFIDFYETHLEPEEFVVLRGVSGTLAFITFSFLMLAANMGYLPLNPASLREDKYDKFKPFVPEDEGYYTARSVQNQIEDEPLTGRLPGCVPLLLCSMELSGWTVPLQSTEVGPSSPGLLASLVQRWTGPIPEESPLEEEPAIPEEEVPAGDPCRRFRAPCDVPLLNDFL